MSQPEMNVTDSSGDSDFVQVEAPESHVAATSTMGNVEEVEPPQESVVGSPTKSGEESNASQSAGQCSTACCSFVANLPPCANQLLYWRNPIQTGLTFGTLLALALLVRCNGLLSVVTLLALSMLIVAFTYRTFCAVVQTFQKKPLENPFNEYLARPLVLPEDKVVGFVKCGVSRVTCAMVELRRLLTVQSIPDSIRFGIILYIVYTITGIISIWTIMILDLILLFTLPRLYEEKKVQIDRLLGQAKQTICPIIALIRAIPYVGQILPKEKTA